MWFQVLWLGWEVRVSRLTVSQPHCVHIFRPQSFREKKNSLLGARWWLWRLLWGQRPWFTDPCSWVTVLKHKVPLVRILVLHKLPKSEGFSFNPWGAVGLHSYQDAQHEVVALGRCWLCRHPAVRAALSQEHQTCVQHLQTSSWQHFHPTAFFCLFEYVFFSPKICFHMSYRESTMVSFS